MKKKRLVFVSYFKGNSGPCIYIAADDVKQAANFGMTKDCQGFTNLVPGITAYTESVPEELKIKLPPKKR